MSFYQALNKGENRDGMRGFLCFRVNDSIYNFTTRKAKILIRMFARGFWIRTMARKAPRNPNPDGRVTIYRSEEWEPPVKPVFTTQTPEKRPMRWPENFWLPRTPGRIAMGDVPHRRVMRLHMYGCVNRRVYHLVIAKVERSARIPGKGRMMMIYLFQKTIPKLKDNPVVEQLGTYDPHVNAYGEKLMSLNIERILHYMAMGVEMETGVQQLLGLAGLMPQNPKTYMAAWRNRRELTRGLDTTSASDEESEQAKS